MTKSSNVVPDLDLDDHEHHGDMRRRLRKLSSSLKKVTLGRKLDGEEDGDGDDDDSVSCSDVALLAGLVGSPTPDPFSQNGTGTLESYTCETFEAIINTFSASQGFNMQAFCGCEGVDDSATEVRYCFVYMEEHVVVFFLNK